MISQLKNGKYAVNTIPQDSRLEQICEILAVGVLRLITNNKSTRKPSTGMRKKALHLGEAERTLISSGRTDRKKGTGPENYRHFGGTSGTSGTCTTARFVESNTESAARE